MNYFLVSKGEIFVFENEGVPTCAMANSLEDANKLIEFFGLDFEPKPIGGEVLFQAFVCCLRDDGIEDIAYPVQWSNDRPVWSRMSVWEKPCPNFSIYEDTSKYVFVKEGYIYIFEEDGYGICPAARSHEEAKRVHEFLEIPSEFHPFGMEAANSNLGETCDMLRDMGVSYIWWPFEWKDGKPVWQQMMLNDCECEVDE